MGEGVPGLRFLPDSLANWGFWRLYHVFAHPGPVWYLHNDPLAHVAGSPKKQNWIEL